MAISHALNLNERRGKEDEVGTYWSQGVVCVSLLWIRNSYAEET